MVKNVNVNHLSRVKVQTRIPLSICGAVKNCSQHNLKNNLKNMDLSYCIRLKLLLQSFLVCSESTVWNDPCKCNLYCIRNFIRT